MSTKRLNCCFDIAVLQIFSKTILSKFQMFIIRRGKMWHINYVLICISFVDSCEHFLYVCCHLYLVLCQLFTFCGIICVSIQFERDLCLVRNLVIFFSSRLSLDFTVIFLFHWEVLNVYVFKFTSLSLWLLGILLW